jgi:hypothetical protein
MSLIPCRDPKITDIQTNCNVCCIAEIGTQLVCCGCSAGEIVTVKVGDMDEASDRRVRKVDSPHKTKITAMTRWEAYLWVGDEDGNLSVWSILAKNQVSHA